jgi:type IX secretion system PorP/SprF family membrane protein
MKKHLIIIAAFFAASATFGQQELMLSQYMFNGLLLNPAYTGSHPYFTANVLHRSQWVKFDKAPTSQVVSIDGPIANDKLGIGLLVTNDAIGITKQLEVGGNVSYKLDLGRGKLAFGLRAALSNYSAALTQVELAQDEVADPVYASADIRGEFVPKFGFGIYYYQPKFYAGLSVPTIFAAEDRILVGNQPEYFANHFYFNTGVVWSVAPLLDVKPSILVKYVENAPVELDINCNLLFAKKFWLGAGYRTGDALVGMLEYNVTNMLRIGYAYDYTLTAIRQYSNGSHEIMIALDFGQVTEIKTRSPRYF